MVSEDLSWEAKIGNFVKKANRIFGMLKKTFYSGDPSLWRNLDVSLVGPQLEYAVQAWNPYLEKDIMKIERVQIRASKIPKGLSNLSYDERLKILNITSLEDKRVRDDLIEMYKVVRGQDEIEWTKPSVLRSDVGLTDPVEGIRGNQIRLCRNAFRSRLRNNISRSVTQRYHFFTNSFRWNKLPETVVSVPSLVAFKSVLDGHHKRFGCYGH